MTLCYIWREKYRWWLEDIVPLAPRAVAAKLHPPEPEAAYAYVSQRHRGIALPKRCSSTGPISQYFLPFKSRLVLRIHVIFGKEGDTRKCTVVVQCDWSDGSSYLDFVTALSFDAGYTLCGTRNQQQHNFVILVVWQCKLLSS